MAVPREEAIRTISVVNRANKPIGPLHHREYNTIGARNIRTKLKRSPVMKNPNMMLEAMRRIFKMSFTSEGSAIEAPANSSLSKISTGLNQ